MKTTIKLVLAFVFCVLPSGVHSQNAGPTYRFFVNPEQSTESEAKLLTSTITAVLGSVPNMTFQPGDRADHNVMIWPLIQQRGTDYFLSMIGSLHSSTTNSDIVLAHVQIVGGDQKEMVATAAKIIASRIEKFAAKTQNTSPDKVIEFFARKGLQSQQQR
ncbi:MAG: hypothetical protein JNJ83_11785 [Verrucomicrobiaceae bacterium]|nr:hypothetical protein [Verrucomicrobiaceae bacterium]